MARVRTVDFLPEIFQTSTNKQFLSATLDQLVQEPQFKKTQGFVGRKVGPGVNADDQYVLEPTATREDYQLEPGVVFLKPGSKTVNDAITYPGINDALAQQGAIVDDANRLYTSDFYTWDPFIDFDKFVNYSQYYWLPAGPDDVDVSATAVPLTDNITVTRENGVYTFSGINGNNPSLTLVRGGNYTFQVAQNAKETVNFRVTNKSTSAYVIDYQNNPNLTLVRGNTYVFNLVLNGIFPFWIKTSPITGRGDQYNNGVLRNGATTGIITFTVPQDAPDTLYYASENEFNMKGTLNIVDASPGTGPGFWIQTDPGVDGKIPSTPNISSRDVLGVINNGEDLGTVTFNVPQKTAQNFYYSLESIGGVDFVTNLKFNEINNQFLVPFLARNGGIDGITNLNGRTIVFLNQTVDAEAGGWQVTTQFDPVASGSENNGLPGTFDTTLFDQTTDIISQDIRYSVWQIQYVTAEGGDVYIKLNSVKPLNKLQKFNVLFGNQYASTNWYRDADGYIQQIPLLTAIRDLLYYQDGTDAEIFGQIKLIEQDQVSTIDIDNIIGKKNYTSPNGVVFTNGLKVTFRGSVNPTSYQNQSYYVEGVGTAIKLLPVTNYITPETYTRSLSTPYDSTGYDVGNYDSTLNAPIEPDYLTINRASIDLNAWSRSNRWFHVDVINATAEYNQTIAILDNNFRGKRPIIEFQADTRLFNMGTEGKQPVNIIDFSETDALSNINGSTSYSVDGYDFLNGSRVIFAADSDPQVRNKIYEVQFIVPDTVPPLIAQPIINLVPASDSTVLFDQCTVCLSGNTLQGKTFYFDGTDWISAQDKTGINQAPLFDVFDTNNISLSNTTTYPSSTFTGSKLFSYAVGSGVEDTVLSFPLKYLSLTNVGDIVFDNNLYADTFTYVEDSVSITKNISIGFVHNTNTRTTYTRELGWQRAVTPSLVRQQFQFSYDGSPLLLDVAVLPNTTVPSIQLYVADAFQTSDSYTVTTTANTTTIVLNKIYTPGAVIEVQVLSDQISKQGFYTVPINLENNPFNINSPTFTLGTIRSHYETIGENLLDIQGSINGPNNTRDLGDIGRYGHQIIQQSSPLTLSGFFMRNQEYNIFKSLAFNEREYIKFKSKLLETVVNQEWPTETNSEILDAVITELNSGKTELNSFYWSDMLPSGSVYTQNVYTVTPITTSVFDTVQTYDFYSSNYLGLLVFLNGRLLTLDVEYTVAIDGPRLTITTPLSVGDKVTIREFTSTAGNFVPNTPTKLGLYPAFQPRIFVDTNYVDPTLVIQGHDGSITIAFGDIRDDILLEFETRIFNNLKTKDNPVPLVLEDVLPGNFRTTDYTQDEITQLLSESFLTWVGYNKLDYKSQNFIQGNAFTYNYSDAGNKQTDEPLLGAWRGISRYFYDTVNPNLTPWEMLGLTQKPTWWEDRYGIGPYTSDNLVLWDDLEAGYVADPIAPYTVEKYKRPGLVQYFIPTGPEGELLAPLYNVVGQYDPNTFRKSWAVGDGSPTEAAWWSSSSYPFAVMRVLALTRPAEFFALFADRDLYKYSAEFDQYLLNSRYRLDANGVQVYGNGVSKASYINWIVDYNQQLGLNSTTELEAELANLDVRLCYRMASFSDKQYLKIFTERSSPNSLNSSFLLPDESYNLLLYKNVPFDSVTYSSVIIQMTDNGGYSVSGYSNNAPFFQIFASQTNSNLQTIEAGGTVVRVPKDYSTDIVQIPYGYTFSNQTVVVDFLLSYGKFLTDNGLIFSEVENGYTLDWKQMAREFLYWANQGWSAGSILNLNPAATKLQAVRAGAVADSVITQNLENLILDQNRQVIDVRNLVVERIDNSITLTSIQNNQSISYAKLNFVNYETMIILDNVSIFADLIYNPGTGARQNRVNVVGWTTTEWNGVLNAQGFILNQNNIEEWQPSRKYSKGDIVLYKNVYYSAQTIVQPKVKFDYNDWVKSDWTKIQRGLLPNIANKSDQLASSYDVYSANLERDNDLLSYGLTGFRPREYMAALNLDDVSQIQLYQQFLKTKGTKRAADIFAGANLGKEIAEYYVYENWAVQRAVYGANANRSFFELRLNEALLNSDPATIQVVLPEEPSIANQPILLSDIWKESYKLTSPQILPTTYTTPTDTALPSAGYVNLDDVDITVFSLDDPAEISANLNSIGIGTKIWVAKSNDYDWNVYRANQVPGNILKVSDNLDGTSVVSFTVAHGLVKGDLVVIRYFSSNINGVYRVIDVPRPQSLTIAYAFSGSNQTTVNGDGLAYYLESLRVSQASDIADKPYANSLRPGAIAWVDDNGAGHWEVLEKQAQFASNFELTPDQPIVGNRFGSVVAQNLNNVAALVSAPGFITSNTPISNYNSGTTYQVDDLVYYNELVYMCIATTTGNAPTNTSYWLQGNPGGVYTYLRGDTGSYIETGAIELETPGTLNFGNAIAMGNVNWNVIGADQSNNNSGYALVLYRGDVSNVFNKIQLLVSADASTYYSGANNFGTSVIISANERWMYIGSPGENSVYAYGRVDVETQKVTYVGDGSTTTFNYSDYIISTADTNPEQLIVNVNNVAQFLTTDYTVVGDNVVFVTAPDADADIVILRRSATQLDKQSYINIEQDSTSGSGTNAQFAITRTRGVYQPPILTAAGQNYAVGNTLTIDAATIGGGSSPANDLVITVTSINGTGGIVTFTATGSGVDNTSVFDLAESLYSADSYYSFSVSVDGIIQRPFIDYTFSGTTLTFVNNPAAGAEILVLADTHWQFVDKINTGLSGSEAFGSSLATTTDGRQVFIGAPNDTVSALEAGSVYVFDRSVIKYLVTDTAEDTYAIGTFAGPVSVLLNGQYLTDSAQYINGQFSVVGSDIVISGTVNLTVGDVIEIETNIFNQVQQLTANTLYDNGSYGAAVDVCPTNCSVYVGSPNDGLILTQAGSVERRINQSRIYGVISSTVANPTLTAGNTLRINDFEIAVPVSPNNTVTGLKDAINNSIIPNVIASVSASGILTIGVKNSSAATPRNKLTVLPGVTGTAFDDLGFEIYIYTQTITSPNPSISANFGASVHVDTNATNLVVSAPNANLYDPDLFDDDTTYFDDNSTTFFNSVNQCGIVYTFDYLPSSVDSINNPGKFVFGQQIYDRSIAPLDQFGISINYTSGKLLVGSPGTDAGDSNAVFGRVAVFENLSDASTWTIKHVQQPVVDTRLLNSVYMYDRLSSNVTNYLDFINPLQGKILGVAQRELDFIGAVDPANYNQGVIHNNGNSWGRDHVGQIWWDTNSVRFIDPNQDDIVYASRRWSQVFPGSRVDIYQWIEWNTVPANYTGPGTPLSTTSYTVKTNIDDDGIISTSYYFWVRNISTVATTAGKKLSTTAIASYIESPRTSGIPYLAALDASTVAIYNSLEFLSAQDTILHIEYDRIYNSDNVHTEFELIAEGKADSFLSANLYLKLQDSFCGANSTGAKVPDPTLSPAERYGVQFRPRQSMFVDRFEALKNYLDRVNSVIKNYAIVENRSFNLLNSSEPEPTSTSGAWNKKLATIQELGYQNLNAVPLGYKYLISSDSTQFGFWTIYEVVSGPTVGSKTTALIRVQTYDTPRYWYHINWYLPGYNSTTKPVAEVPVYSSLTTLSVPVGSSVKVTANAQGKFEIYLRTDLGWDRVGLEDGTIQFSEELWDYSVGRFGFDVEVFDAQYFDQEPVIETRKIIQAINEELFIDDLAIERNRALTLMFEYVLTESLAPEWLLKTSLVDVEHRIRSLLPYQIYRQDNQDFVLDYIQEVKPYHVQIKEFNLTYNGIDSYAGSLTDFDLPAYYDTALLVPQFVSPILLPYTKSTSTTGQNINSDVSASAVLWSDFPYNQWYNNYLLEIQSISIVDGGAGYTVAPQVEVSGTAIVPAELEAIINSAGQVVGVEIIDPGVGYAETAIITFVGGNGVGARATAVMGNDLIRSIKTTLKYDRCEYTSTIIDWEPGVSYTNGTQVRYLNRVWSANSDDSTAVESLTFDPLQWALVDASTLSGADRTMGFYAPSVNEPGLELPLLIDGITYPGVQVYGPDYTQVIELDAIYESYYGTPSTGPIPTGDAATDINVDGGAYIDTFSSHAPEELIPGSEFDTLDLRVYTQPGSDWARDGHGFAESTIKYALETVGEPFSFAGLLPYPAVVLVSNQTTGVDLYLTTDYTINWIDYTVTIVSSQVSVGDTVAITVYELGGGNQLFRGNYTGNEIGNSLVVPIEYSYITEMAIFANGELISTYTYVASVNNQTLISFDSTYTLTDRIVVYVLGATTVGSTTINYSWSAPQTQYIIADGTTLTFDLDNSIAYSNPDNMIVTVNGSRARTSAGREHYATGSEVTFSLPERLGFSQALISDTEVIVYLNDILQVLGVDYTVDSFISTSIPRTVTMATAPIADVRVLVCVRTNAQCVINSGQLEFNPVGGLVPVDGDTIAVTTWNDTRQQDIVTQVFVGPVVVGITVSEGYDETAFDSATVNDTPGSYSYSTGSTSTRNDLFLEEVPEDGDRLWVTLNGRRLWANDDFEIVGNEIVLNSVLGPIDLVMVTQFTDSVVPEAMAFRIFQDMRGVQATYRMTPETTTYLVENVSINDDIIYVYNASALPAPNVDANIWGVVTINGERIMYRERDTVNNTISSLLRGTAGTAVASHSTSTPVYDMSRDNLLPEIYQNYIDSQLYLADGSTATYVVTDFNITGLDDSTIQDEAVEVYVGGTRQSGNYTITQDNPLTVVFDTAPESGVEVTILVRRGVTWYAPGIDTPSNGVALQDTNTQAARFLRGL